MKETLDEQSRKELIKYRLDRADETMEEVEILAKEYIIENLRNDTSLVFHCNKEQWINVFIVKRGDKYGCINNKGELTLPINYDKIILDSYLNSPRVISILTYKDGKVGFGVITYFYSDNIVAKKQELIISNIYTM